MKRRLTRRLLVITDTFLAFTAVAGGIGLLTGANAPPVALLAGSVFPEYTIPGLALMILVGGSSAIAALLTARDHPFAALASVAAGLAIVVFELVEIMAIGSPPGMARTLQVFYLALGGLILLIVTVHHTSRNVPTSSG